MLTAEPTSVFSWSFDLVEDGVTRARIAIPWWSESGTLEIDSREWRLGRERLYSGTFYLRDGDRTVASARKPSAFASSFVVEHAGETLQWRAMGFLRRRFELASARHGAGELRMQRLLSRSAEVELPETLPLEVRGFLVWLALLIWRRQAAASS